MKKKEYEATLYDLHYWRLRCQLAEAYIAQTSNYSDVYPEQIKAYNAWKDLVSKEPKDLKK